MADNDEMSTSQSTLGAKLKAASQEESLLKWKEHLKNMLRNTPEITDKPTERIINNQVDPKLGQFTVKDLDKVLKILKAKKLQATRNNPKVKKTRKFDSILRLCNTVNKRTRITMNKSLYSPLPQECRPKNQSEQEVKNRYCCSWYGLTGPASQLHPTWNRENSKNVRTSFEVIDPKHPRF